MGISGFFGKKNLSKSALEFEISDEIYAKKENFLKVRLVNSKGFLPLFLIKVKAGEHELFFPFVDRGAEAVKQIPIVFMNRGIAALEPISVCSVFPFNFFIRCRTYEDSLTALVFPEPRQCALADMSGRERKIRGDAHSSERGYESDLLSVREYILGDPLKYIHWKATAKTDELKTKELSSSVHQPVIIDFDKIEGRDIESRLSCAAYMVISLIRKGIPVGMRIQGKTFKPGVSNQHKLNILKQLALYNGQ